MYFLQVQDSLDPLSLEKAQDYGNFYESLNKLLDTLRMLQKKAWNGLYSSTSFPAFECGEEELRRGFGQECRCFTGLLYFVLLSWKNEDNRVISSWYFFAIKQI